jgi:hypothetical protein
VCSSCGQPGAALALELAHGQLIAADFPLLAPLLAPVCCSVSLTGAPLCADAQSSAEVLASCRSLRTVKFGSAALREACGWHAVSTASDGLALGKSHQLGCPPLPLDACDSHGCFSDGLGARTESCDTVVRHTWA